MDSLRLLSRPGTLPGAPSAAARRASFRSALGHSRLRWLVLHHTLAGTGQSFGTVAVATAVFASTGSAGWVAVATACRLVPYLLFSGPAGVVGDRVDRRSLLLVSALARAAVATVLLAAVVADAPAAAVVALVFVGTALGTGSYPTLIAVLPRAVPLRDVPPANAIANTVETAVWLVGPALGGLLVLGGNPEPALAANVVLFLLGAAALLPVPAMPRLALGPAPERFRDDLVEGLRAIAATPIVRRVLVMVGAVNLVMGAAPVLMLLAADDLLDRPTDGYSTLTVALGAGGFLGVAFTNRLSAEGPVARRLAVATLLGGLPFAALAVLGQLTVASALVAVAGAAAVVTEVVALTVVLRSLPDAVAARVFGLVDALLVGALLVGSVVAPALVRGLGLQSALAVTGLVVPALAVAVAGLVGRGTDAAAAG